MNPTQEAFKMKNYTPFIFTMLLTIVSARTGAAQTRTYRAPNNTRASRRSYEYDEQNSGEFPNRKLHLSKKRKAQSIHKPKVQLSKEKRPSAPEIENNFYGGISFSTGMMPFVMNGDINLQLNYLQDNANHSYTGSIRASDYNKYCNTIAMCTELGKMNGIFGSLSTKAILLSDLKTTPNLTFDFILGRNHIFHNNRWRFSPAIGLGVSFSSIDFHKTIDNSQGNVLLLSQMFPQALTSKSSTTHSDKITPYLKSVGGDFKIQATIAPRIKNNFPIRFTLGYSMNFLNQLSLGAKSPLERTEFSCNSPGVNLTNSSTQPNHTFANQGVYFEITFFINTTHSHHLIQYQKQSLHYLN